MDVILLAIETRLCRRGSRLDFLGDCFVSNGTEAKTALHLRARAEKQLTQSIRMPTFSFLSRTARRATATREAPAEGGTATGANERKGENSYRRLLKGLSSYCLLVVKPGHAASKSSCNQSDNGECRKDAHGLAPYFLGLI